MASVLFVRFTGILAEPRAGPPVFLFDEFGGGGGARAGMGSVCQAGDRNILGSPLGLGAPGGDSSESPVFAAALACVHVIR